MCFRFLSALFIISTSSCVSSNLATGALLRPLRVPVIGKPTIAYDDFRVTTADGYSLQGWHFSPKEKPRAVMVLLHGKDINRQHFLSAVHRFVELGLAVVMFDQRAHGESTGEFVTYGAKEVKDLQAVIDFSLHKWGEELPVVVVGESLGAAVALQAAAVEPRIKVVVAGASFANLNDVINLHTPFFMSKAEQTRALALAENAAQFRIEDISPENAAAHIEVPTLLLHGSEDNYIPLAHSLRIYAQLGGPKQFVRLEGVTHIGILQSDAAWDAIERFVSHALPLTAVPKLSAMLRER